MDFMILMMHWKHIVAQMELDYGIKKIEMMATIYRSMWNTF